MSNDPLVSVVIPAYNAGRYIAAAIDSALGEIASSDEIVIVDDGSNDDTQSIVKAYGSSVTYIYQTNGGAATARNTAVKASRGKYLALLDADDMWLPNKLNRQVGLLERNPSMVLCGCQARLVNSTGGVIGEFGYPLSDAAIRFEMYGSCPLINSGVVVRRDAVLAIGGYSENATSAEDYDLWTRISASGEFVNLPATLVSYRVHGNSVSSQWRDRQRAIGERARATYAMATGVVSSQHSAKYFCTGLQALLGRKATLEQAEAVCDAFERFVTCRDTSGAGRNESSLVELRRRLRWLMLNMADFYSKWSREYWSWVSMARRVDPEALKAHRIAVRAIRRAMAGCVGR